MFNESGSSFVMKIICYKLVLLLPMTSRLTKRRIYLTVKHVFNYFTGNHFAVRLVRRRGGNTKQQKALPIRESNITLRSGSLREPWSQSTETTGSLVIAGSTTDADGVPLDEVVDKSRNNPHRNRDKREKLEPQPYGSYKQIHFKSNTIRQER